MPHTKAAPSFPPLFYTDTHSDTSLTPHPNLTTLFLHGLGSSSNFYAPIIPSLAHLTRCIAIDLPGSGLSALPRCHEATKEPSDDEMSIGTIAEDMGHLLDCLGFREDEKVVVVGHSMGGMIASVFAARFPNRVRAVVLLGPVVASPEVGKVFVERIKKVQNEGLEKLADTIPSAATSPSATPLSRAFVRTLILGTKPEAYIALCRTIVTAPSTADMGLRMAKCPLLVLVGEDDKTAPLSMGDRVCDAYGTERGRKEVKTLEGVGHWYCVEKSDVVGVEILRFLEGLE